MSPSRTEGAPLRRKAIRIFDNSVERASRERADSGISPKRSHKIDHRELLLALPDSIPGSRAEAER